MKTSQKPEKYTIRDFHGEFQTETDCLAYIFWQRFPKGRKCESCGKSHEWKPVTGRRSYACSCGHHFYPLAGTVFHKSSTPLKLWFHAIFLFSASKNGVSGKELQRQLGVTYKCAYRIGMQIRKLMNEDVPPIKGTVEVDDTWHGPKVEGARNPHKNKAKVLGMVERGGNAKAIVVKNLQAKTLIPLIKKQVSEGTDVMTDEARAFHGLLDHGYLHRSVSHCSGEYVCNTGLFSIHTNTIESFWSQLKRCIKGTYVHVSGKHLQKYCDEFSFRYNRRKATSPMFRLLVGQVALQPA